jgi:hypothetical protein
MSPGPAVALQLDADHPVPADQLGDEVAVVEVDGRHAAVQQHQRGALTCTS